MGNAPGFKQENWQPAKDEIRRILVERAIYRRTIEYTEPAGAVHSIKLERQSHELAELLREISTEEAAAGRGMLSAVVVHDKGNRMPVSFALPRALDGIRPTSGSARRASSKGCTKAGQPADFGPRGICAWGW